jgi:hypothetical protein
LRTTCWTLLRWRERTSHAAKLLLWVSTTSAFEMIELATEVGDRVCWRTIEASTDKWWEQDGKPGGTHDEKNQCAHEFTIVLQNCYKTDN